MLILAVEFLDELVFGVQDAAWTLIRDDLQLDYVKIGLLLSVPGIIANLVEPVLFILGDLWRRRVIILGGGLLFTIALGFVASAENFVLLLGALVVFFPASGAFVSLSQATLMDAEPTRREQNMARWAFAGSLGVFIGPLLLGTLLRVGLGWRPAFWGLAAVSALMVAAAYRRLPASTQPGRPFPSIEELLGGFRLALRLLANRLVLRWLILLEFADLLLDVFYGFLALYLVDEAGVSPVTATLGVSIWAGLGLLGDLLLIPLLERVPGIRYLPMSVAATLVLFPAFLLVTPLVPKLALLGSLGLLNSGWYAILRARLYESAPANSGTVLALDTISGMFGRLLPLVVGGAAQTFGLANAMWLLLLGPLAMLVGLPRGTPLTGKVS